MAKAESHLNTPDRPGMPKKLRLVFMGTPDFAADVLRHVADWEGGDIVGVYTQPDRKCGRGQTVKPSPVKQLALDKGYDVHQPVNFKDDADVAALESLRPDILLVAAYGLILPQRVLDIATHGAMNVHASLLPKYRGAAPIQRAILDGEPATGVTIMQMEAGLDTGPMLLQRALGIAWDDTAETIHDQLADMGGRMLAETMQMLVDGQLTPMRQDDTRATYAAKLTKKDGLIDWDQPAAAIHNRIRAMHPWPGAYFMVDLGEGKKPLRLSLQPGRTGDDRPDDVPPGTIMGLEDCDKLKIAAQDKIYLVPAVQPQGKRPMSGEAFYCGYLSKCDGEAKACS
jgi:methionyl-tRNA formyltransferase